jgi:hypothetical protein
MTERLQVSKASCPYLESLDGLSADTAGTAGAHRSSPSESLRQVTPKVGFAVTPASVRRSNPGVGIAVTETSDLEWCDEDAGLGCQQGKELHGDKYTIT